MGTIITAITGVFSSIGSWFVEFLPTISALFYAEGALTFIGTLSVCGLAVSIFLLVVNMISNFLNFR